MQVGLLGMARTLQRDLDKIAEDADTTTPEGLHYILTGTAQADILQQIMVWNIYAQSSSWMVISLRLEIQVKFLYNRIPTYWAYCNVVINDISEMPVAAMDNDSDFCYFLANVGDATASPTSSFYLRVTWCEVAFICLLFQVLVSLFQHTHRYLPEFGLSQRLAWPWWDIQISVLPVFLRYVHPLGFFGAGFTW